MSGEQFNPQDTCGCCDGVSIQSPVVLDNRPGLSAIAYRIGTHGEILAGLQARLSAKDFPALAHLHTRDKDDFSIALLDAYACMADVLTFYQERIANESYLRTAGERLSLSEMARLIGYRLKPGVAAETYLAFTMQEPPPQVESKEPKQATGVPEKITLDQGIKVQSIPGPNEKPQTFETVESMEMRPVWNLLRPQLSQIYLPVETRTDCWFKGSNLNIKAGDALLLIGEEYETNKNKFQFRVINSVVIDSEKQRTQVVWSDALDNNTPVTSVQPYLLRRRASVFGNNAPMWATMPDAYKDLYESDKIGNHSTDWPDFTISTINSALDMDAQYADIKNGQWCVLVIGTFVSPFTITNVSEVTRSQFALNGKVTRLMLLGANYLVFKDVVRATTVYSASEKLSFSYAPLNTIVNNNDSVVLNVAIEGMRAGHKLMFSGYSIDTGKDEIEVVTLKSLTTEGEFSKLIFEQSLQHSYLRDTLSIYGNVAFAIHGETVYQTLGSGVSRQANQRFSLGHAPLTYIGAENETGAEAALEVRINDILWHETTTLFNAVSNDHKYVLRTDEDGKGTIQFGDGKHGSRLPTGQENVRAVYRKGLGAVGNLKAGQLSQLLSRPLGLKAVSNPLPSEGGVDADSTDNARRNMPLGVRTLGRVVSIKDYEDFARAYTGIAKAQATVLNTRAGRTVFITVAGDNGVPPPNTILDKLLNAFKQNGDPLVYCGLAGFKPKNFNLALRVKCDPDYLSDKVLSDVEAALRAAFSFEARDFGQIVSHSEVIAEAQKVTGVLGVDLDSCYLSGNPGTLADRLYPATATVVAGIGIAAEILLLDQNSIVDVKEMT